jgi:MFS family permease
MVSLATADGVWTPARRLLTAGLVLMVTVVASESLSVATILPVVGRQFGHLSLYGWVFSAFFLGNLVGIAAAGAMADRFPLAWPMIGGLALFGVGLVVGGTAGGMPVLVVGRAIQGVGAGAVPAIAYVAIGRDYPTQARARMLAVISTAWVLPALVGPAIAALVANTVGWRWVFLGLLPLVAASMVMAGTNLGIRPSPTGGLAPRLNFVAVAGAVVGGGVVLAALTSTERWWTLAGVAVGGVALVRSLLALTPPHTLVAAAGLPATILSRGLLTFCFYAGDAYVPYALTNVRHSGTEMGALALSASALSWSGATWVQERSVARNGPRRMIRMGEACVFAGLGLMALALWPLVAPPIGVLAWAVAGCGMGLAYPALSLTAFDLAPAGEQGRTTASLQTTDVLGQALGTGVAGAAVASGVHSLNARFGVALAFGVGAVVAVLAWLVGGRLPRRLSQPSVAGSPLNGPTT